MKVVMMKKQISTNVLAEGADSALRILCDELYYDLRAGDKPIIIGAQIAVVDKPLATQQTIEFVETSGAQVPGYYKGMDASKYQVYTVVMDLEYVVNYEQPKPASIPPSGETGQIGADSKPDLSLVEG